MLVTVTEMAKLPTSDTRTVELPWNQKASTFETALFASNKLDYKLSEMEILLVIEKLKEVALQIFRLKDAMKKVNIAFLITIALIAFTVITATFKKSYVVLSPTDTSIGMFLLALDIFCWAGIVKLIQMRQKVHAEDTSALLRAVNATYLTEGLNFQFNQERRTLIIKSTVH